MQDKCRFCETDSQQINGMYFFGYFICRHCLEKIQRKLIQEGYQFHHDNDDKAGE